MLTNILLHKLTDHRNYFSAFRIEESNDHLNQKKEDNDLRHIFFHNLKRHNENHLYNDRKMTQADQHTQNSENALQSVSQRKCQT